MSQLRQSDRERLNLLYQASKEYEAQAQQIQMQIDILNQTIAAAQITGDTIENLKNMQDGQEILLPLGNLAFIKAKLMDSSNVLVNVGASVVVTKTIDAAKKQIDGQAENLSKTQVQLQQALQQVMQRINQIRGEMENLAMKIQQQQQQQQQPMVGS
ncbi:MAG: prefoldin subunit alpha [Candidatus Helarchaeota archaeon]